MSLFVAGGDGGEQRASQAARGRQRSPCGPSSRIDARERGQCIPRSHLPHALGGSSQPLPDVLRQRAGRRFRRSIAENRGGRA